MQLKWSSLQINFKFRSRNIAFNCGQDAVSFSISSIILFPLFFSISFFFFTCDAAPLVIECYSNLPLSLNADQTYHYNWRLYKFIIINYHHWILWKLTRICSALFAIFSAVTHLANAKIRTLQTKRKCFLIDILLMPILTGSRQNMKLSILFLLPCV